MEDTTDDKRLNSLKKYIITVSFLRMYHYWIQKSDKVLPIYNLENRGSKKLLKKRVYSTESKTHTNGAYYLVENKIVGTTTILEEFNVVDISDKVRFIFNDLITILELDEKNINLASSILSSLVDVSYDNVFFFID